MLCRGGDLHRVLVEEAGLVEEAEIQRIRQAYVVDTGARPIRGIVPSIDLREAEDDQLTLAGETPELMHLMHQIGILTLLIQQLKVVDHHKRIRRRRSKFGEDVVRTDLVRRVHQKPVRKLLRIFAQRLETVRDLCRSEV